MAAGDRKLSRDTATGQDTSVAGDLTVVCGFKPKLIVLQNRTTGVIFGWSDTMAEGQGLRWDLAGTVGSNGFTPTFNGFTMGANVQQGGAGEELHWTVFK